MGLSAEEIRRRLEALPARWSVYEGSERAEAETFLNQLFDCYGQDRRCVARFEEPQAGRFVDLIWPRVCLIEMKDPSEAGRLARHRNQALAYWRDAPIPSEELRPLGSSFSVHSESSRSGSRGGSQRVHEPPSSYASYPSSTTRCCSSSATSRCSRAAKPSSPARRSST